MCTHLCIDGFFRKLTYKGASDISFKSLNKVELFLSFLPRKVVDILNCLTIRVKEIGMTSHFLPSRKIRNDRKMSHV